MKSFNCASTVSDPKSRSCLCSLVVASLICGAYFISSGFIAKEYKDRLSRWEVINMLQNSKFEMCKIRCRPLESEALPQGIVVNTSNLETRPLWSDTVKNGNPEPSANFLAVAVGIKQKEIVDQIVKKFPSRDFVVMLFHYDVIVEERRDLEWSDRAIHYHYQHPLHSFFSISQKLLHNAINVIDPPFHSLVDSSPVFNGNFALVDELEPTDCQVIKENGDIETLGRWEFDGNPKLIANMTAHPKVDSETKETFAFRFERCDS